MVIGILTVEYVLHGNDSLKGDASAQLAQATARLRLAVVSLSNSERHLTSRLTKCLAHMEAVCDEEMVYSDIEFVGV